MQAAPKDQWIEFNGHIIKADSQVRIITELSNSRFGGDTARELENRLGWDHGKVSGALSALHKIGYVELLEAKRNGMHIYVLPEYTADLPTKSRHTMCPPCPKTSRTFETDALV